MSNMHNPPHPGEVLQGLHMEGAGINITALAKHIGVDRKTMSRLINGKTHMSAYMALRLSKAFDTTPDMWLNIQNSYDLWKAQQTSDFVSIKPIGTELKLSS